MAALNAQAEHVRQIFMQVLDFAMDGDSPQGFIRTWMDGDWDTLRREWPEYYERYTMAAGDPLWPPQIRNN